MINFLKDLGVGILVFSGISLVFLILIGIVDALIYAPDIFFILFSVTVFLGISYLFGNTIRDKKNKKSHWQLKHLVVYLKSEK